MHRSLDSIFYHGAEWHDTLRNLRNDPEVGLEAQWIMRLTGDSPATQWDTRQPIDPDADSMESEHDLDILRLAAPLSDPNIGPLARTIAQFIDVGEIKRIGHARYKHAGNKVLINMTLKSGRDSYVYLAMFQRRQGKWSLHRIWLIQQSCGLAVPPPYPLKQFP